VFTARYGLIIFKIEIPRPVHVVLKKILVLLTGAHNIPQYQNSRKYVQWEPRWYLRTDRLTDGRTDRYVDANRRFSLLCASILQMNVRNLQCECCLETNYIWRITGHDRQYPEQQTLALRAAAAAAATAAPNTWETTECTWWESSDTCIRKTLPIIRVTIRFVQKTPAYFQISDFSITGHILGQGILKLRAATEPWVTRAL
jgi:hypothetical protein